ncbi:hypothetical protein BFJ63_vAg1831 [Fusarium oxysporum f. sp. narcissi]|uniref:Uncharacterized protein n=1 Tax=Fusarium oxysporum f. sp. narcissi TaxID=451672 RepID=A0A4Q2W6X2_FUSOX|nr:hypothetical protein BFJ70_g15432 [Fusarium oxysporum]RYC95550.1 hypothetical protein BFJ63_vAg1831 [Fusarium oxysporum f. sp. narcissi]
MLTSFQQEGVAVPEVVGDNERDNLLVSQCWEPALNGVDAKLTRKSHDALIESPPETSIT